MSPENARQAFPDYNDLFLKAQNVNTWQPSEYFHKLAPTIIPQKIARSSKRPGQAIQQLQTYTNQFQNNATRSNQHQTGNNTGGSYPDYQHLKQQVEDLQNRLVDTKSRLGELTQRQYEIKQTQQTTNTKLVTLEANVEQLDILVKQVIHNQRSNDQAVISPSHAVSNLTTKKETAIMQKRLEHMFGRLMERSNMGPYDDFPPELRLTMTEVINNTGTGLDAMSDDESNAPVSTLTVTTTSATTTNSLGSGNHNNSHLVYNPQTNQLAPK
jgi:hypothetical protein